MGVTAALLGLFHYHLPECRYVFQQVDGVKLDLKRLAVSELAFGVVAVAPFCFLVALLTKCFVIGTRWSSLTSTTLVFLVVGDLLLEAFLPSFECMSKGRDEQNRAVCLVLVIRVLSLYAGTYLGQSFVPIALTGSIAAGKSTVGKLLLEKGDHSFTMIDLDKIGHEILIPPKIIEEDSQNYSISPSDSVFLEILATFGDEAVDYKNILDENERIDRRKLGRIIFENSEERRKLNRITHPRIILTMVKQLVRNLYLGPSRIVCADVPLLFESGKLRWLFAITIVVVCKADLQLERLRKRNPDLSEQQCRDRIASQIPVEEKAKLSDTVIWNNGSMEDLEKKVEDVKKDLVTLLYGPLMSLSRYVLCVGGLAIVSMVYVGLLSDLLP